MATAADIPGTYDIIVNGQGYILATGLLPSLPFRTQRARYGYTPTFLTRQNITGNYGDNQQDFFLTASQNNWVAGGGQHFFRSADTESTESFWNSDGVDVSIPGQIKLGGSMPTGPVSSGSFNQGTSLISAVGRLGTQNVIGSTTTCYFINASDGTIFGSTGLHGLGTTPRALVGDSPTGSIYISGTAAGTVGVRKYDSVAGTWSTFSATPADSLAVLNNTLYGYSQSTGQLMSYSVGGVATTLFTWKNPDGTTTGAANLHVLKPYGGKLLILRQSGPSANGTELWQYDGTNTNIQAKFADDFTGYSIDVVEGLIFVGGWQTKYVGATLYYRAAIYEISGGPGGTMSRLWQAADWSPNAAAPAIVQTWSNGIVWNDDYSLRLRQYDISSGAIVGLGTFTSSITPLISAVPGQIFVSRQFGNTSFFYPGTSYVSAGNLYTSLFDFDSSLTKLFRAVVVDWVPGNDGNGGSVDISYRVGDVDGTYTSLQVGAVSGQEYTISGVSGRSISIKLTLNKGTSTMGPVIKRVYVRAVPILSQFRLNEYVVDCSGRREGGKTSTMLLLRNGKFSPLTGQEMANNLVTAATSTVPISISDRFGTFTGIIEPENFEMLELRPEEFYCRFTVRQV